MDTISKEQFKIEFFKLLKDAKNVAVISHVSPDEDSIGSVLSVYEIVTEAVPSLSVRILQTGERIDRYAVFKNFEKIEFVSDVADEIKDIDTLILLDAGQYYRISKFPDAIAQIPTKICIDHHASTPDMFNLKYVDPTFSSASELVYTLLVGDANLTPSLSRSIFLGILGDTGHFTYIKPEQSHIFSVVKTLVEKGNIAIDEFSASYAKISPTVFTVVQELMKNTSYLEVAGWPACQYSFIPKMVVAEKKFSDNDISSGSALYMAYFLRMVKDYDWGFVITPRSTGDCRVSFRSLPKSVNVRDLTERMKIGGGHDRSAGSSFKKIDHDVDVEEALENIKMWMQSNAPLIQ